MGGDDDEAEEGEDNYEDDEEIYNEDKVSKVTATATPK